MTKQPERRSQVGQSREKVASDIDLGISRVESGTDRTLHEASSTLEMLRTETDRVRGLMSVFGFGRRILVPPDEIHVVVGDGRHSLLPSKKRRVYGQTADRPSFYWLNKYTQVIKLKTISFTVPIRGANEEGVHALDNSKVSFRLWAHAVAKLNPDKADIAAQRVGLDATSLINTITEVGTAELVAAAATMDLQEIIAERQKLAEIAFPQVNQILSELGYDLALLTITQLDGVAYRKLVEQAESRISKETAIATNREQVAEIEDRQTRERREAEIQAETEKKLAAERLEAERDVETATLEQQEVLAVRRHEVKIREVERDKEAAKSAHEADLAKVELDERLSAAEVEKNARLQRIQAEREADLADMRQQREAKLQVAETEAEAEKLAVQQARQIKRDAERTRAEAERLREEELQAAERAKQVALVDAESKARSTRIQAEGETEAELIRAEAEANATEKRAQAAKIRAEATRAEAAAPGLAEAEVESARVEVAEKQVAVKRAEGLAETEISEAKAKVEAERLKRMKEVEISTKQQLMSLYTEAPVLVDLEKLRMELEHEEKLTRMQMDAYLQAFKSVAPGIKVHIYGNGGQMSQIMNDLFSLSLGVQVLGDEVPAIGRLMDNQKSGDGRWRERLVAFLPHIRQVLNDVNPRMFSSLKVADLVERLEPVIAGEEALVSALERVKDDANFRVVGDLPVQPLLQLLGIQMPGNGGTAADADLVGVDAVSEAEADEQEIDVASASESDNGGAADDVVLSG